MVPAEVAGIKVTTMTRENIMSPRKDTQATRNIRGGNRDSTSLAVDLVHKTMVSGRNEDMLVAGCMSHFAKGRGECHD